MRMRAVLLYASVLLVFGLLLGAMTRPAAAAPSAGCVETNTQSIFSPPNGYNGAIAVINNYLDHSRPYADGEKLTISVNTAAPGGVMTVTLRNSGDTVTYGTMVLSDGASATFDLPAGAVGLRFQNASPNVVNVTNLVISCTPVPTATKSSIGNDSRQAARHITSRTSAAAVQNFSKFVSSAVRRRFSRGGASNAAPNAEGTGQEAGMLNSSASSDPGGNAMLLGRPQDDTPHGSGYPAMQGGSDAGQLAVTGARLADSMLGSAGRPLGLWAGGAATFLDYDRAGGAFDGSVTSVGGGMDRVLGERLLAGVAVAYERGDIDSAFNNGGLNSEAISFAPYIGWRALPNWVVDANLGLSFLDYDMNSDFGAVRGEFDATRIFGAVNATGNFRTNRWRLSPSVGILFFSERQSSYTDSAGEAFAAQTIPLGRLQGGLEAGYTILLRGGACRLEPYARLGGEWDFVRADAVTLTTDELVRPGELGASIAAGLNILSGKGWSGNLEASYDSIGRSDYESATILGSLLFTF